MSPETKGPNPAPGRSCRWHAPVIAILAVVLYLPTIGAPFVNWDDEWLVVENPLTDGIDDLAWILDPTSWREPLGAEYLPVRDLSFWIDHQLWGLNPVGYHLENALLYGLVCALALLVLRDLTRSRKAALIGALLFVVHPVHVESVAWVSERKGLLAALFLLASWLAYRRSRSGTRVGWLAGSAALFLLAACSKSTVHFFALLVPMLEVFEARRAERPVPWPRVSIATFVFVAISAAAVALNTMHQASVGADYGWGPDSHFMAGIRVASTAFGYVGLLLVPIGLSIEYEPASALVGWVAVPVLVLLVLVTARAFAKGSRYTPPALFALLAWLPVSNIVALPNRMADRYLFIVSLGVVGVAGLAFEAWMSRGGRRRAGAWCAVGLIVVALGALSVGRMAVWRDPLLLWQDAADKAPRSVRVQQNLGVILLRRDRPARAFECFHRMLDLEPEDGAWWAFVARQHEMVGNLAGAETLLREGMRRDPNDASTRINLAMLILIHAEGMEQPESLVEEARRLLHEVTRMPDRGLERSRGVAHLNLGSLYLSQGRAPEGIDHTRRALESDPSPRDETLALENLVQAYRRLGRESEARGCEARLRDLQRRLRPLASR